jgi:hypothetical protein
MEISVCPIVGSMIDTCDWSSFPYPLCSVEDNYEMFMNGNWIPLPGDLYVRVDSVNSSTAGGHKRSSTVIKRDLFWLKSLTKVTPVHQNSATLHHSCSVQ